MVRFDDLRMLLSCGANDKQTLYHAIQRLPHPSKLPADVVDQIVDLVPQIAELLSLSTQISCFRDYHFDLVPQIDELGDGELDHQFWCIATTVCQLLAHLGPRAQAAVPALLEHIEMYPRFELNAWAIGEIGGPGVVRKLIEWMIEWTYWGQHQYDRKCYDSLCGAIRRLGEPAIAELLELSSPTNACVYQRNTALLNLVENTNYPVERSVPLIASELDRIAGADVHSLCGEMLRHSLIRLGNENAETVVAAIHPLLLAKSAASEDFIHILSELGDIAFPPLAQAVEENIHQYAAISALAKIGGAGLDYVYEFITLSMNRLLVARAIRSIPNDDERSLEVLTHAIAAWRADWEHWWLIRRLAVLRLAEFSNHQAEITAFLNALSNDPDTRLVTVAAKTSDDIANRDVDGGDL